MLLKIETEILSFFPEDIKKLFLQVPSTILENAFEIRFRTNSPILILSHKEEYVLKHITSVQDILRLLENFSNNSIYSIQNEINSGFITIKGRT